MATALVGALLAATLIAVGRHTRQVRRAQDRLAAIEVANDLLHGWLVGGEPPQDTQGSVAEHPEWSWRLRGTREPGLGAFVAHLGTLEILSNDPERGPLASIEFVSTWNVTASQIGGNAP